MGCCNSAVSDEKGERRGPRPAQGQRHLTLPTVEWERVQSWEDFRQKAIAQSADEADGSEAAEFKRVRDWLGQEYPECAREGTIEDVGEIPDLTISDSRTYKGRVFLTLDSAYTGVVLASTLVLAAPVQKDHGGPEPRVMLDTPEMELAKRAALTMMRENEQRDVNINHAECQVVVGADMLRCKYKPGSTGCTITPLPERNATQIAAINDNVVREILKDPVEAQALRNVFLPMNFRNAIRFLAAKNRGCTVWDGGELPFNVDGVLYPEPTRLLIARRFENNEQEADAVHYRVIPVGRSPTCEPAVLVRARQPGREPNGIVHVELYVGISKDVLWPAPGAYAAKPPMKAAVVALVEYLQKLNRQGKMQRCIAEVEMGADRLKLSFVGDKFDPVASITTEKTAEAGPEPVFSDLDRFSVTLEEQKKHELFESESQFQAIKQMMRERAQQDPNLFAAQAPVIAQMTAKRFLEMNFPGCEVLDEGEMPATIDGETMRIRDTRLVIGRNPSKNEKNIIAAIMSVPLPGDGGWLETTEKSWLNTKEMKTAELPLLDLLKRLYREGKIAEDCMAQVIMGTDAAIYRFVDGERFEDYDDERMKQFSWG